LEIAMTSFTRYTFTERPDRADEADQMQMSVWPEIMMHDPVANQYFHHLMEGLAEYQFMLCDEADAIVGVGFAVPLVWEPSQELPDTGWDWVLRQGVRDFLAGRKPTAMSAISAAVINGHQGQGISSVIIAGMRSIAQQHGLPYLIAPVRPNLKHRYPLTPMARYITWQTADGLPFDPWLRVHARLGAKILKIAPRSMKITGSIAEWESWTEMRFPESGKYTVPGALNPVTMNLEKDLGVYVEPNVWMVHKISDQGLGNSG
jgi:GNAT superfamily N-acetyltransferase